MNPVLKILLSVISTTLCLLRPGGTRKLVAENLALKQQLIVLNRSRNRAPNLTASDRILFALYTLLIGPERITRVADVIRLSTLFRFHRHLVKRKYSCLFTPKTRAKPGSESPPKAVIELVLELKRRNPTFGSPRIASIVNNTLGVDINKDVDRNRIDCKPLHGWSRNAGPVWLI